MRGEEVVAGDPRVSDAERAAAGRETMAGRFAALLGWLLGQTGNTG